MSKLVPQLNSSGYFVGFAEAQESPLEPGVFLIPAGAVDTDAPPAFPTTQRARFSDGAWTLEDIPLPDETPISDPVDVPIPPITVSPWQLRKALNATGLRTAVEAAVTGSADQDLKDGWQFATEFRRNDGLVVAMGASLGKTEAELDALFTLAASL